MFTNCVKAERGEGEAVREGGAAVNESPVKSAVKST